MNNKNSFLKLIILHSILFSLSMTFAMEDKKAFEKFEYFSKLPLEIQKEILKDLFKSSYIDQLIQSNNLIELNKILNLSTINKAFKDFLKETYFIEKIEKIKAKLKQMEDDLYADSVSESYGKYVIGEDFLKAINNNNVPALKKIINKGYNYNNSLPVPLRNAKKTALIYACQEGKLDIVRFLLDNGLSDINAKDKEGMTALMYASSKGYEDVVKLLIDHGANIISEDSLSNKTAINLAKNNRIKNILKNAILKNGFDIDRELIAAVYENNLPRVKFLIYNGADLNFKNNENLTSLMIAARKGYNDILKLLLSNGADVNLTGGKLNLGTALDMAENEKTREIILGINK